MSTNFSNILNQRADAIEAPKSLPPGVYQAQVGQFKTGESTKKKTPYVEITFNVTSVIDVAPEHQEQAEAAFSKGAITIEHSFYLSDKATYILVDFLEKDLGINRAGNSIADMLQNSNGQECKVILDIEVSPTTGKEYTKVKRTAPL